MKVVSHLKNWRRRERQKKVIEKLVQDDGVNKHVILWPIYVIQLKKRIKEYIHKLFVDDSIHKLEENKNKDYDADLVIAKDSYKMFPQLTINTLEDTLMTKTIMRKSADRKGLDMK